MFGKNEMLDSSMRLATASIRFRLVMRAYRRAAFMAAVLNASLAVLPGWSSITMLAMVRPP
jgi:hypothetical protein